VVAGNGRPKTSGPPNPKIKGVFMAIVKAEFDVGVDQIRLTTQTNGDRIEIRGIHLGESEAANLALLINLKPKRKQGTMIPRVLTVVVKEKKE